MRCCDNHSVLPCDGVRKAQVRIRSKKSAWATVGWSGEYEALPIGDRQSEIHQCSPVLCLHSENLLRIDGNQLSLAAPRRT